MIPQIDIKPLLLGDIKFFMPKPKFLASMQAFKGSLIFDVGAGVGHVSNLLQHDGHTIRAIDCNTRPGLEFEVERANAFNFDFPKNSILLFCRPSHGCFVEWTVTHAYNCGVRKFIYVGLGKNKHRDLGKDTNKFKVITRNVGHMRENMYAAELT